MSGAYQSQAPTPIPLSEPRPAGSVYHWLLPDAGMAAFDSDKVIKELAADEVSHIKKWRKEFTKKITAEELKNLQALSDRADALWQQHVRERQALLERTRTEIEIWGQAGDRWQVTGEGANASNVKRQTSVGDVNAKDKELEQLYRPTSPFRRLKMAMDYWCALWFWRIPEAQQLPTRQQFWNDVADLFAGVESEFVKPPEQLELLAEMAAPKQAHFADLKPANVDDLCRTNARLKLAADAAEQICFHHWELVFAEVFAARSGFDALLGNPPWVKLSWNESGLFSDYHPLIALRDLSASDVAEQRTNYLDRPERIIEYLEEFSSTTGTMGFLNSAGNYSKLKGMQSNLFKCFITQAWALGSQDGVVGLLHPEGVYEDPAGGLLREEIYHRLKLHFQFHNEKKLFPEVGNTRRYSVNVYRAAPNEKIEFDHIVNLFHPYTIDQCYNHDGMGIVPGIKDSREQWEVRGHRDRIVEVNETRLALFALLYDETGTKPLHARLPLVHSEEIINVLQRFSEFESRLINQKDKYFFTEMWHETNAQRDGTIRREVRFPNGPEEWILSGPHMYVATPFSKTPNENCNSHRDYKDINLTEIPDDYLPRTNYVPACSSEEYLRRMPKWKNIPMTQFYRYANRNYVGMEQERTLISATLPPKVACIGSLFSIAFENVTTTIEFTGLCSSIVYDFFVRVIGKPHVRHDVLSRMPIPRNDLYLESIRTRTLRLNCLTIHYAALWEELYTPAFNQDSWTKHDARLKPWNDLTPHWQRHVALRTPFERRQALVEIDVLAALALNLTLDELITIYRVQFPVLQKNERPVRFDQRGMEVPMKTISGELCSDENHVKFAEMVPPFTSVDREADYREAWKVFEGRMRRNMEDRR